MEKEIFERIHRRIKYIWEEKIKEDYENCYIYNEDTLKNALYYHIRTDLEDIFKENNIRIFTEYTDEKFNNIHCRPDLIIAEIEENEDCYWVKELIAVFEIKYKVRFVDRTKISDDYEKLRGYLENNISCDRLYMATIWEYEDDDNTWIRKNAKWAKGRVTELNASVKKKSDWELQFYVREH